MSYPKGAVVEVRAVYHVYVEGEDIETFLDLPDDTSRIDFIQPTHHDLSEMTIYGIEYE
jgi:hypothetical protein